MTDSFPKYEIARALGSPIIEIKKLGLGRNNRVFKITCSNRRIYVVKLYFKDDFDDRKRLNTEFTSLKFLREYKITNIPEPILVDYKQGWAVFHFIDGQQGNLTKITPNDIDDAVRFLLALKKLTGNRESIKLPPASEACFSIETLFENINSRLHKLLNSDYDGEFADSFFRFINDDLMPAFEKTKRRILLRLAHSSLNVHSVLPVEKRTISPSDFGFHNALRCFDGTIFYVDFEYFGWDDPAKMVCDFILHPAMSLSGNLQRQFVRGIISNFDDGLSFRISITYPLFVIKWCIILLNEFVPDYLRRRKFADETVVQLSQRLKEQLLKAKKMLDKLKEENGIFQVGNINSLNEFPLKRDSISENTKSIMSLMQAD